MHGQPSIPVSDARKPRSSAKQWLRAIEITAEIEKNPQRLLADIVHGWADATPDAPALVSRDETVSYAELSRRINQVTRWAVANAIGRGTTLALMMPSCPDYLAMWMGLTRTGAVVALINTNLVGDALGHCIRVAGASHVIAADDYAAALDGASLESGVKLLRAADVANVCRTLPGDALDAASLARVTIDDPALMIYTSGTTGLPKAAAVSHRRVLNWGGWFAGLTDAVSFDRMYNCLPLYHSVGGCVATGSMFFAGGSVFIAEKFSSRNFWSDIARFECTLFQYIGELCRYLVAAPHGEIPSHRLRLACGNGLRGDVWEAFQERFAIPRILEFYAATEGNFSLYNVEGKVGAIGKIPSFLTHRFPAAIVRFDVVTGLPTRDADGRCIRCARGEAGEAIGRIGNADEAGGRFEGYTSDAETEKKILRNVFEPGDAWFRTGDLMTLDAQGYFHFVDRIGDTFRWKGENVAASEVADVVASCPGISEVSVYGVEVPGADGRAGMAAIVADDDFDVAAFHAHVAARLPAYARPVFIRNAPSLAMTETFKQKKHALATQGFDPRVVEDDLYVLDGDAYRVLDDTHFAAIVATGRVG